jgi:hypothetical protein
MANQANLKRWIAYGLVCLATIFQGMVGSGKRVCQNNNFQTFFQLKSNNNSNSVVLSG